MSRVPVRIFRRVFQALLILVALALVLSGGATLYALRAYKRTWDVPLPATRASTDTAIIARGEYLVNGPAHCADCHAASKEAMQRGEIVPLTGGFGENTFLGHWIAPNLTPDSATGIGAMSDGQIARVLRTGVNREGRLALPFKDSYADMTEEDLVAVLSYLRSLKAEPGVAPRKDVNILGKITLAYFMEPYGPKRPPVRERFEPEATPAYGDYLANVIGRCESCHTPRSLKTGEYLGPPFSGGLAFKAHSTPGVYYVTPNLTPDPETGIMAAWTEDAFVDVMRRGTLFADSPMPWGSYRRMTDVDLRAIYRYLSALAPVHRDNGPSVQTEAEHARRKP
jgi:mono/diheme cytochrome c family protein